MGIVEVGIVEVGIVEVGIVEVGKVVPVVEWYNHQEVGVDRRVDHSGQSYRMREVPLLRTRPFLHSC